MRAASVPNLGTSQLGTNRHDLWHLKNRISETAIAGVAACALALLLTGVVGCAGATNPPWLVGTVEPRYPVDARRAGVEGYVLVAYDVTADGLVTNPRVVESEPAGVFDAAAVAAVSRWRFQPPRGASADTPLSQVSRVTFTLGDGDEYTGYE